MNKLYTNTILLSIFIYTSFLHAARVSIDNTSGRLHRVEAGTSVDTLKPVPIGSAGMVSEFSFDIDAFSVVRVHYYLSNLSPIVNSASRTDVLVLYGKEIKVSLTEGGLLEFVRYQ